MSLLIRSDGHPNVVRYFLKEEHGDFIYLALQLCCMSLKLEHESIDSNLVLAIESNATEVIGNSWDRRLPIKLYRSRLCNHWETTRGTICPMRKKGKCDFAHGPLELRIKDTRRDRWGKPPQPDPSTISPIMTLRLSGGEDVLGVARQLNNQQNYNQQPQIGVSTAFMITSTNY
eukprot:gene20242-26279_t